MSTSTWSVPELQAMASAVDEQAAGLAGAPRPHGPAVGSFGHLLEPPATHTFPATNEDITAFLEAATAAVTSISGGLGATAEAYRLTEEQALDLITTIFSAGAPAPGPAPAAVEVTPRAHWALAGDILEQGAAAGADAFSAGNPLRMLLPTALDWLDFPAAVHELVSTALTWLAATVISYFGPFDDALTELTGDAGAIRAARATLDELAEALGEHAAGMQAATGSAQQWAGTSADVFAAYARVQSDSMAAAQGLVGVIGPSIEGIAQNTATARQMIMAMVANILDEVIRYVTPNIFWFKVALGLAFVPGGIIVSGAILAKMVADFIAWLLEFLATEMQVMAEVMRDVAEQGNAYLGQVRQLGESMARAGTALQTGQDPGIGYGVDADSMAGSMFGTDPDPRDGLVIDMMAGDIPPGFSEVSDPDTLAELGLTPDMLSNDENGFAAHVYQDEDGNVVIIFEGTDFSDPAQTDLLKENVPGGTGMGPQSQMAIAIAQAIGDSDRQGDVIYGGHSLGGRLAAIAAMTSGNPAVTANAAGVSDATMDYIAQQNGMTREQLLADTNGGLVRAYRTDDDILTNLQENWPITSGLMPDHHGTRFDLGGSQDPVAGHGSDNVQREYNQQYGPTRPHGL
ncbi:hypothetical protein ACPCG0_12150 [Propionibacteriaceae bacterium Y1923]